MRGRRALILPYILFAITAIPVWTSAQEPVPSDSQAQEPIPSDSQAQEPVPSDSQAQEPVPSDSQIVEQLHTPIVFLHDRFFLDFTSRFATTGHGLDAELPGRLGLEGDRLAEQLPGVGFRRNGMPYQQGEYFWLGGDGRTLAVRADRRSWEAETLAFPPAGGNDPVLLPGPGDSTMVLAAPLLGFSPAELVIWHTPELPDSAKATAHYANGPRGFSYTGGRFHGYVGGGLELDAQVYRIFSDGLFDGGIAGEGLDGHNFDLQLRYRAGRVPLRLRFRQNRATRDLAFRWQPEISVASQLYLLSHVDVEAAYPVQGGEWLASYQLRHEDQRKTIPGLFTTEQKWFNRRHDMSLSRLWNGRFARWLRGGVIYRQSEEVTGLPTAWAVDLEGGVRLTSDRMDFTLTGGWRSLEDDEPWWRLGSALAWTASRSDRILVSAGGTRRGASELVRYLPASPSAGAYIETGDRALQHSEDVTVSVSWRHRGRAFDWDAIASGGRSDGAPAWLASGDTAILNATYQPYNLTREFAGAALNIKWRTFRWLGIGGSYDRLLINEWDGGDGPAFSPNETWHGYLQFTLRFLDDKFHVMPVVSTRGARGGTLPDVWATVSAGVDARLKQLTVFWHRENLTDQEYRTGGWAPAYGLHSRFGFSWDFWK